MSLSRIAGVACLLLVTLGASACSNNETTPQSTPWPTSIMAAPLIRNTCYDHAAADAEAQYGDSALAHTDAFSSFSKRFEQVGDPFGVPAYSTTSDEFVQFYEELVGRSPWENPQAAALFDEEQNKCLDEMGFSEAPDSEDWRAEDYWRYYVAPSPEEWPIVECVARALVATEAEYGEGSVDYTTAYRAFVDNRSGESTYLSRYEQDYERVTGRSPFRNSAAMEAFRARAKGCPEG